MEARLGDVIDDFCIKCKRLTNHAVVSLLEGGPAKVRCRTCYNDHDYRHELQPPPKVDPRKLAAAAQESAEVAATATGEVAGEAVTGEAVVEKPKGKGRVKGRK